MNFNELINREWVILERALLPQKKDKYALFQLINPGFDSRIKVYHNIIANKTTGLDIGGVPVTGNVERSYIVSKDGQKTRLVRKSGFLKDFEELFADKPELLEAIDKRPKFKYFASYVLAYDQLGKDQ